MLLVPVCPPHQCLPRSAKACRFPGIDRASMVERLTMTRRKTCIEYFRAVGSRQNGGSGGTELAVKPVSADMVRWRLGRVSPASQDTILPLELASRLSLIAPVERPWSTNKEHRLLHLGERHDEPPTAVELNIRVRRASGESFFACHRLSLHTGSCVLDHHHHQSAGPLRPPQLILLTIDIH